MHVGCARTMAMVDLGCSPTPNPNPNANPKPNPNPNPNPDYRTMATAEVGCSESIERSSERGSKQHAVKPSSSSSASRA